MTSPVSYETWMATVHQYNEAKEEVRRLREALADRRMAYDIHSYSDPVDIDKHPLRYNPTRDLIESILFKRALDKRLDGFALATSLEIATALAAQPAPAGIKAVREAAADGIRRFCQSLGAGAVTTSSDGVERIYEDGLAGLDERLDRLLLTADDGGRFVLSTESAKNIVAIVREWLRPKGAV